MTTTYEIYTNDGGTPKAVTGNAPAIVERVENLENAVGSIDVGVTSVNGETGDVTVDVGVTSVNGNVGDITPEQTGCLPLSGGTMTGDVSTNQKVTFTDTDGYVMLNRSDNNGFFIENYDASNVIGSRLVLRASSHSTQAGVFAVDANDGTTKVSLIGKPSGSLTWDNKNIVRSVNGTNADASGNVSVSTYNGSATTLVSELTVTVAKGNSVTTKTISGLTPYKPARFELTRKSGYVKISCSKCMPFQSITETENTGVNNFSLITEDKTPRTYVIYPIGTTLTVSFNANYNGANSSTLKVYQ